MNDLMKEPETDFDLNIYPQSLNHLVFLEVEEYDFQKFFHLKTELPKLDLHGLFQSCLHLMN